MSNVAGNVQFLAELENIIARRIREAPEGSYTAKLAARGIVKVAQKIGEEGVELALAAAVQDRERVTAEAADLFYHALIALVLREVKLSEVMAELERRHASRR
jgi:phosphoribosyl-ATP pyrophosphohydrolase/phosphoribosyl-AMP cyclohydrolase